MKVIHEHQINNMFFVVPSRKIHDKIFVPLLKARLKVQSRFIFHLSQTFTKLFLLLLYLGNIGINLFHILEIRYNLGNWLDGTFLSDINLVLNQILIDLVLMLERQSFYFPNNFLFFTFLSDIWVSNIDFLNHFLMIRYYWVNSILNYFSILILSLFIQSSLSFWTLLWSEIIPFL